MTKKKPRRPRSIFQKALDALKMDWNDTILNKILQNKYNECILWTEHLPTACARIDALKTHGFDDEALRLAIAIARTMRHNQSQSYNHWMDNQLQFSGRVDKSLRIFGYQGSLIAEKLQGIIDFYSCYTDLKEF